MTQKPSTRLIHARSGGRLNPTVNPPLERASTLLLDQSDALYGDGRTYGRAGLAQHGELAAALCDLEGASAAQLTPSGVSACALAAAALTRAGDHIIAQDSLYGPTRRFCERRLKAMGVEATFVGARDIDGLHSAWRPETKLVFLESPGSLSFEIPDLQQIVAIAHDRSARVIVDNTWSAGLFHQPLALGADVSVQALTKYAAGHSDAFGGVVLTSDDAVSGMVSRAAQDWGVALGPDDAYLALRGLRTLSTRLKQHEAAGRAVADWLAERPEVQAVIHPARSDHPDFEIWKRDFSGATGLFSAVFHPVSDDALRAFFDGFALFGLGFSWGGFESLAIPCDPQLRRLASDWTADKAGPLVRFHIGLEDVDDLITDLDDAFDRMRAAA